VISKIQTMLVTNGMEWNNYPKLERVKEVDLVAARLREKEAP